MRELTVRIRFNQPCLGNVKDPSRKGWGRYLLPRSPNRGPVIFLGSWHARNLEMASEVLGRHRAEVPKIHWDIQVDGVVKRGNWYRYYYAVHDKNRARKERYTLHEMFEPGCVVGINCVVPATIPDEDFWSLLQIAGKFRGISPWKPTQFGRYEVVSIRPRRGVPDQAGRTLDLPRPPEER